MKRHGTEQMKKVTLRRRVVCSPRSMFCWALGPPRGRNPRAATDAQQITSGNASAIVAMVPICTATLMAMVPLAVYPKDPAADRVRVCHLSRAGSPRTLFRAASDQGGVTRQANGSSHQGQRYPSDISFRTMNLRFVAQHTQSDMKRERDSSQIHLIQ